MLFVKSSFKKSLIFFFLFWYPNREWAHAYLINTSSTLVNLCAYFHLLVAYSLHSHRLHHHYLASFHNWTSNTKCLLCHLYLACVPTFTYLLHVYLIHLLGASSLPSCLVLPPYMFVQEVKNKKHMQPTFC
jgi:hypothetical protein